jgi:hypothetical protein
MADESTLRRPIFREGIWIRMADGQAWLFPRPLAPGLDPEYDATVRGLHEAEDHDEALRFELALGILLLARNYDLSPRDYEEIFGFGTDHAASTAMHAALSEMIAESIQPERLARTEKQTAPEAPSTRLGALQTWWSICATRLRSLMS